MKKVLFVATVDSHIKAFHIPYLKWFKNQGWEVLVASNGADSMESTDKKINIPMQRSPFKLKNLVALMKLYKLIKQNKYEILHCHTPMGGVLARIAAMTSRKKGTKVIYTAHGFHFYKGAPLINWLLYYPIEKWLARYTDVLITINEEDYTLAVSKKFKARSIEKVDGVGIDLNKFKPLSEMEKQQKRSSLQLTDHDYVLTYVAELSYRKHQDLLIHAIDNLRHKIPNIRLLLVGSGEYLDTYQKLVDDLNLSGYVRFLGYRTDVSELLSITDVYVSSSRQEGLPINVLEALAAGLPIVVSDCRGNRDIVENTGIGDIVQTDNVESFSNYIINTYKNIVFRKTLNLRDLEQYSLDVIIDKMAAIYLKVGRFVERKSRA